jgi:hypothetical protein
MQVKVTSKDFGYAVKFLKKNGYTFDNATKTWSGTSNVSFLVNEGYATEVRQPSPVSNDCMLINVEA